MQFPIILAFLAFGVSQPLPTAQQEIAPSITVESDCGGTPVLNQGVMRFVKSKLKKRVGRGECWDLAAQALESIDAKWNGAYVYGQQVNPKTDCIYPGDIIQFKGVKVQYTKNGRHYTESMKHHTAVVYEVYGKGHYRLAHQNTGFSGRRVGLSSLNLAHIKRGKIWVYRPVR